MTSRARFSHPASLLIGTMMLLKNRAHLRSGSVKERKECTWIVNRPAFLPRLSTAGFGQEPSLMMKICSKCKSNPALSYHAYCYECLRIARGQLGPPKFRRDSNNTEMCSKCKASSRLPYHNYCQECKNESVLRWEKEHGGWKNMNPEQRKMAAARHYLNTQVRRGKLTRLPCEVCGNPKSQGHHYMGYEREFWLVVKWLCSKHHREAHKITC